MSWSCTEMITKFMNSCKTTFKHIPLLCQCKIKVWAIYVVGWVCFWRIFWWQRLKIGDKSYNPCMVWGAKEYGSSYQTWVVVEMLLNCQFDSKDWSQLSYIQVSMIQVPFTYSDSTTEFNKWNQVKVFVLFYNPLKVESKWSNAIVHNQGVVHLVICLLIH
jgi:hypothetical protein